MTAVPLPDDLLTTRQAASLLGVRTTTITRMVAKGRLTPVRKFPTQTGGYLFLAGDVLRAGKRVAS